MFTGIIIEQGTVASLRRKEQGAVLAISAGSVAKDASLGDSIAVSGVCLTVVEQEGPDRLSFDLSGETLSSTTLGTLKPRDKVNLEPSLRPESRLGGHFVTGHVDGIGKIISRTPLGDAFKMIIEAPENVTGFLVDKGSVALDGISLTVVDVAKISFSIVIIPHTAHTTTLGSKGVGDTVNLETDILGKYVARFLSRKAEQKPVADQTFMESLRSAGFLPDAP